MGMSTRVTAYIKDDDPNYISNLPNQKGTVPKFMRFW